MTKLEKYRKLRDELQASFDTIAANPHTGYDNATVEYAKRCLQEVQNTVTQLEANNVDQTLTLESE